jgi:hypothetical protein
MCACTHACLRLPGAQAAAVAPRAACLSPLTQLQLLEDPYLLAKFKSEIADKRSRANDFTRTLTDVSRTLRGMGLYHSVQVPVEDELVHVDIALPDYKVSRAAWLDYIIWTGPGARLLP